MAYLKLCTLLLQIKLLLWKNFKLKTRRWKEIVLMIGFAVFSMLLIGVFRSDVDTQTIPSYQASPQPFFDYLLANHGKIAIINKLQDNDINNEKILYLQLSLQHWFKTYQNNLTIITNITSDSILDHMIQNQDNDTSSFDTTKHIKLAIDINKWEENIFDYTIRLPSSWVPSSSEQLIKSDQQTSASSLAQSIGIGHSYSNQFIPLQIWMDQFFILYTKQRNDKQYGNNNVSIIHLLGIQLQFQPFWTTEHEEDPFMDSMGSLLPFYIVSCFLLPFSYMIKDIVEEKSAKIKEGMRTMGLHILSFWISWFLTYLGLISIVASIVIFIQWKTSMFIHTSFTLLYVLYLIYGFSIITFASVMTTFFDKPKTASTVSGFTYFILQMPAYAIKSKLDTVGLGTKMIFSLFSPTAMFLSLLSIIDMEQNGAGYTFDNLFDTNIVPATQNGYCLGYSMIMLLFDIILYVLLTWFLDQYIRSEYGQKLTIKQIFSQICCCNINTLKRIPSALSPSGNYVPYKPLSKHQRNSIMSDDSDNILLSPNDVEMNPMEVNINNNDNESAEIHKNISIQIINLSKTYDGNRASDKSVRAVNNLSINIYESECCALLGSNGAGKTTTINMLTGMIDTTSGTANINGYNINHEMDDIRQFLGVCPQSSLLWPMLTVYEHLYLFANLKNMRKDVIDNEIDLLLHDVGLSEKKKSYSSTLSGGQKRKLSLAIAFIGNPKIIFLDEPTSGMDPVSRRYTWDLIEKYKENRCIVLTTHDMNEADAIADRIAIMSHGQLRIYGSSIYLKSVCGVGYNLIFTIDCKRFNADDIKSHLQKITNIIQEFIENAILFDSENVYGTIDKYEQNKIDAIPSIEVIFKTAIQDSSKFPLLFDHIDVNMKQLRILHYAVSVTTLEEVFLKIAGDEQIYSVPQIQPFHDRSNQIPMSSSFDYKQFDKSNDNDAPKIEVEIKASKTTPETLSTLLTDSTFIKTEQDIMNKHPNQPSKIEEFKIDQDIIDALCKYQRPHLSTFQRGRIHIGSLMLKRFRVTRRDLRGIITQCIMPLLSLLFGLSLIKSFDTVSTSQPTLDITTTAYQTPFIIPYNHHQNPIYTAIIGSFSNDIQAININETQSISMRDFNQWIVNETYQQEPYNIDSLYGALYMNPSDNSVTFLYDGKATHLLPGMINKWNEAILNGIIGDKNGKILVESHPFPLSSSEVEMVDFGVTLMMVILISLSYAFIPTSFASYIVRERESRVKHQQIIAGLGIIWYWISNLLFDLIIFMIPCIIGGIVILLFNIKLFTQNISSFAIILVFLLFGISVITLTYLLSFLFKNPQSAQTILGRMYEISGLIFLIIGIMLSQFIPSNKYLWCDVLLFIFRLFPNYAFGEGLFNLTYSQQQVSIMDTLLDNNNKKTINILNWDILGRDLCFMFITTISNLILICLIEYITFNAKLMSYFNNNISPLQSLNDEDFEEDTDVIIEKESIKNGEKKYNSSIEIVGLKKVFKSKKNNNTSTIAVNDLFFAVNESEIFGFLGSNGAGKTTTMKMLTKQLVPNDGNAYFKNDNYENNILDSNYYKFFYQSHMGYCPQNDGLIELLTGREHLELYCRIRGFSKKDTINFVNILIESLNLKDFSNRTVNKYSGGNRRKLCVGIALIGNPSIVMLDEPSTGIDPISRRFMWNFIESMTRNKTQKRCVLLTTHSMEEAESLCDRIGIMDKGNLQCLGTAQHVKNKYGKGYEIYIKLKENFNVKIKDELKKYVLQNIINKNGKMINIKLIDDHNVILRFSIRLNDTNVNSIDYDVKIDDNDDNDDDDDDEQLNDIPLGKIFGFIENIKNKYEIVEYSISQNTLEQVFLHLVDDEEQNENDENNQNQSKCNQCCV